MKAIDFQYYSIVCRGYTRILYKLGTAWGAIVCIRKPIDLKQTTRTPLDIECSKDNNSIHSSRCYFFFKVKTGCISFSGTILINGSWTRVNLMFQLFHQDAVMVFFCIESVFHQTWMLRATSDYSCEYLCVVCDES